MFLIEMNIQYSRNIGIKNCIFICFHCIIGFYDLHFGLKTRIH